MLVSYYRLRELITGDGCNNSLETAIWHSLESEIQSNSAREWGKVERHNSHHKIIVL